MAKSKTIEESILIERLCQRDSSALDYLYDHYSGALYSVVLRVVRKEEIAEEVLQDVFIKIWDRMASYDPTKGRLFTWMLNIARNQAIDKTRSREMSQGKKTDDIDNLVNKIDRQESAYSPIEAIGLKEVLTKLPEDQRFVIDHLYLKGFTQSELAEEFGIPLGTIKTRTRMAMKELRSILNVT
ncbi:MAG: sigma-70 family RNA polymerase sigma factor [Cyclobacteriaceae bacterium]|nr:sigma-70 family RNA polymerase sigma factor [Cyclobacteriaceae bacterium]